MSLRKNKKARFIPFWILFCILGLLLLGAMISPMKYVLDDAFRNIEENAVNNGNDLSCSNPNAPGWFKAVCFSLQGYVAMFFLYLIYMWVTSMTNGAKSKTAVFAPRLEAQRRALES